MFLKPMNATFFDIKTNWQKFIPFLSHEKFLQHVKMYKFWNFKDNYQGPLIGVPKFPDTDDTLFVKKKLEGNMSIENPYYFCVPHECVELNPLVMGALLSLFYNIDSNNIFVVKIFPLDSWDGHIVVTTQKLEPGLLNIAGSEDVDATKGADDVEGTEDIEGAKGTEDVEGSEDIEKAEGSEDKKDHIILYDLIYPLCDYKGHSWHNREIKLDCVNVYYCLSLADYINGMAYYTNYFKKYPYEARL